MESIEKYGKIAKEMKQKKCTWLVFISEVQVYLIITNNAVYCNLIFICECAEMPGLN